MKPQPPENCEKIYSELIENCCKFEENERYSFEQICKQLEQHQPSNQSNQEDAPKKESQQQSNVSIDTYNSFLEQKEKNNNPKNEYVSTKAQQESNLPIDTYNSFSEQKEISTKSPKNMSDLLQEEAAQNEYVNAKPPIQNNQIQQ